MQHTQKSSAFNTTMLTIAISMVVSGLTFLLPVAETTVNATATHWRAFASTLLTCLFTGASIILLRSLKNFKPNVKTAFRYLAYGMLAFSVTLVQFIFWGLGDLWTSDWATSGSGLVPIAIATILIYAGARKFAKLMGVKTIMNSFWFVAGVSVAVFAVLYVLAMNFVQYKLDGVEAYIGVCGLGSTYVFFAAMLVHKVSKLIGSYYARAMRWLTIGLFALFIETSHEGINTFWFNNGDVYTDYGFYLIPFVIAGFLVVRAGYEFRLLPAQYVPGKKPTKASTTNDEDYIESVVAVGGLVSRLDDVETILDELRLVTSHYQPGTPLKNEDKDVLVKTYFSLESYLVERDVIRNYTKDEVREHVSPTFRALLEASNPVTG
jgi:hypothetical protein